MEQTFGSNFKVRRRQITISAFYTHQQSAVQLTTRGRVGEWNKAMSNRLGSYLDNFRQDFTGFMTLTYPAEFPADGITVKRHWRAFIERIRRRGYFGKESLVWFLEFQARGAPHIHAFLTGFLDKDFVADAWAEITGGNRDACSQVKALEHADRAGCYAKKYAIKNEQKHIPEGFENVGRWWGVSGARILNGVPRLPCVAASTLFRLPHTFRDTITRISMAYDARLVETLRGFTIYGSERQVREIWHYLRANIALTDRSDQPREEYNLRW